MIAGKYSDLIHIPRPESLSKKTFGFSVLFLSLGFLVRVDWLPGSPIDSLP